MTSRRFLHTLFNVLPDEAHAAASLTALYFTMGIAFVATQTAAYALFVTEFGSASLPYSYFAIAIGTPLLTFLYLRLAERIRPARFLLGVMAMLALVTLALWIGLQYPNTHWIIFLLPLWALIVQNIGAVLFWGLMGVFFDIRQTKRLGSFVNSGKWLAFSIGGFVIPLIVTRLGTVNLLSVAVGGLLFAFVLLVNITRRNPDIFAPAHVRPMTRVVPERVKRQSNPFRSGFVLLVYSTIIFSVGAEFFVNNIFYDGASAAYGDASRLAAFTAIISALAGLSTLVTSLFITGRLLNRYGIAVGLLAQPLVTIVVLGALALLGTVSADEALILGLATLAQLSSIVLSHSLFSFTHRVIGQAIPPAQRDAANVLADGVIEPIAIGLAGAFILLLTRSIDLSAIQLSAAFLPIGVVWLAATFLLIRNYPLALKSILSKRQLTDLSIELGDRSSAAVLRNSLGSPHPEAVIYALTLLEQMKDNSLATTLPGLLQHASPEVQHYVLRRIQQLELRSTLPDIRQLLDTATDAKVKEAALRTLAALSEEDVEDAFSQKLNHPDPSIQRGAMIGLLQSGGLDGILRAGQRLQGLLTSSAAADRELAAQVMGEVGLRNFYQPLIPLLHDNDDYVRRAAVSAAGKIRHPRLWADVIEAVDDAATRPAALLALVSGGAGALSEVSAAFERPDYSTQQLIRLVRICGRIRNDDALRFLEARLEFPDADVRSAVYSALSANGYRTDDAARVQQQIRREAQAATESLAAFTDLDDTPEVELLRGALRQQFQRTYERILHLISFIHDSQAILRAREALLHGTPAQKAYAVELLDTTLSSDLKDYILPLVQGATPAEQFAQMHSEFPMATIGHRERIGALIGSEQRWVRACAIYAAAQLRAREYVDAVGFALQTHDPLLEETSVYALAAIDPAFIVQRVAQEETTMTTIEKIIILKTVNIFSNTPDDVLVEVASLLEEEQLKNGETLFEKGDLGTCMYIVVSGKVRIHDGDHTLNYRESRQVFGEMALLDPEPRIASVTAVEETLLFRLDQEPFYELMADQIEVVRGIMRVITSNLRARVQDVAELRNRIDGMERVTQELPTK